MTASRKFLGQPVHECVIGQVAPLHESVPPKLYGGTERVMTLHGRLDLPEVRDVFEDFPEVRLVAVSDAQRALQLSRICLGVQKPKWKIRLRLSLEEKAHRESAHVRAHACVLLIMPQTPFPFLASSSLTIRPPLCSVLSRART